MYPEIVAQKFVTVMVTDKDPDEGSNGSPNLNPTMSNLESRRVVRDDTIWTDIGFKGIIKDLDGVGVITIQRIRETCFPWNKGLHEKEYIFYRTH
jgi:hypothetical protein